MTRLPGLSRLGLDHLAADHWNSLTLVDKVEGRVRLSVLDLVIFFGLPLSVGVATGIADVQMQTFGDLIQGVAILTGLLFGLLTHVLSLGLRLYDDPRRNRASRIVVLTDELRANVSYAIGIGIFLTGALMLFEAYHDDDGAAYNAWISAAVLALVLHMLLTLLMILKRVRSTYRQLGK
jgi:hypothetical protein